VIAVHPRRTFGTVSPLTLSLGRNTTVSRLVALPNIAVDAGGSKTKLAPASQNSLHYQS
jgi:hypothetical protein